MNQTVQAELTIADVRALAASIYEPEPRVWDADWWCCPQCLNWNTEDLHQCACGISRDGLPEFCER
jgi:hypothetical protein